jgi:hypothetical protein
MALPSRGQVYGLFLQILDDPAATVYKDVPNATTGALSVFQAGFSQAFDLLFSNALNQQVPRVEQVVQGIIIPPSPIPFSVTPAAMGFSDFADWEWISERAAGSSDKFLDLIDEDRLRQRAPIDRLLETVYQNGAFQFVGCTTVRELQIKYVSSALAPTSNAAVIGFDNSLNFLANYSAACAGPGKGDDEIAARCRSFSVGPKFDQGSIGGELFRLMQPLVRSRQNVQVAHKPFTTQRRIGVRRGIWYVAAQAGTTGGGSQNVPMQFSSANGTIIGSIDGVNLVFWLSLGVQGFSLYRNGLLQTLNMDYVATNNQLTFLSASVPQPGDTLTAEGYPIYQV